MSCVLLSRGKGKSAVAAAYRAGEKSTNQYDRVPHDYTRKGGAITLPILAVYAGCFLFTSECISGIIHLREVR